MNNFWYNDSIIYHLYAFSVADAPYSNDYSSQEHKLDIFKKWLPHIKDLGCNTVLFSPVLKSKSHGYDVTDYFQLDNRLGTNEEFAELVKFFHENNIKVIIDCVFNHCGRDFDAFTELQKGNREKAEWFKNVDFNNRSPLGDDFTYETWAGFYELVKFNLNSETVKNYLYNAARFWIETFDIDGMRLDAADVLDFDFMKGLRRFTTQIKPDFWLMGEVVHGDYSRWANEDTLHSVTNYILYKSLHSSHNENNLYELAHTIQQAVPQNGKPLYTFLDNHDVSRIASVIKNIDLLKPLYALLFTLPGVPTIYYGSEWGIKGEKQKYSDAPLRPYIDIENPPAEVPYLPEYIKSLAKIHNENEALRYGNYKQICLEYRKPFVFEREYNGEKVVVAVNINENTEYLDLSVFYNNGFKDLLNEEYLEQNAVKSLEILPCSVRILKNI